MQVVVNILQNYNNIHICFIPASKFSKYQVQLLRILILQRTCFDTIYLLKNAVSFQYKYFKIHFIIRSEAKDIILLGVRVKI